MRRMFLITVSLLLFSVWVVALANSRLTAVARHRDETKPSSAKWKFILMRANQAALKGGFSGAIAGLFQVVTMMWLRTTTNYQYRYGVSMQEAVITVIILALISLLLGH